MGLSFSVRPPTPAPPSLQNMYRALRNDYPEFIPPPNRGGLLTPWADRGVLMLNACLTVRAGSANSHSKKGWERLTQRVIDVVNQRRRSGVVFMAWGTPAGQRVTKVDKQRHLVLTSVHPSPLSAHKGFVCLRNVSPRRKTDMLYSLSVGILGGQMNGWRLAMVLKVQLTGAFTKRLLRVS